MTPAEQATRAAGVIRRADDARKDYIAQRISEAIIARLTRDPSAICDVVDYQRALRA